MSIVCFGETLIDFLNIRDNIFEANPGGGPANVSASIARFGGSAYLLSKVGNDIFGKMILDTLSQYNVDVSCVRITDEYFTTLAFVKLDQNGERSFSFARQHGADIFITKEEIDTNIIKSANILHFGSLSMTHDTNRSTTFYLLDIAKANKVMISYDPNYRRPLWKSEEAALKTMFLPIERGYVDILKMSEEEILLYAKTPEEFYDMIKNKIKILLVTMGNKGSRYFFKDKSKVVETIKVDVVDTTGCGDCFMGMFLYEFEKVSSIQDVDEDVLSEIVKKANIAGALCATKKGAIPAIPDYKEVLEYLL